MPSSESNQERILHMIESLMDFIATLEQPNKPNEEMRKICGKLKQVLEKIVAELKVVKSVDAQRNRHFVEIVEAYLAGLVEQLTASNVLLYKDRTLFDGSYM